MFATCDDLIETNNEYSAAARINLRRSQDSKKLGF